MARQCEAAHCQPLEVFTRSAPCTTHKAAMESIATRGSIYHRQQRIRRLSKTLTRPKGQMEWPETVKRPLQALEDLGVELNMAFLAVTFLCVFYILQIEPCLPVMLHRSDLEHVLPGGLQRPRH